MVSILPKTIISTISISCAYDYNANQARFNKISLVREPFATYSYDDTNDTETASSGEAKIHSAYVENSNRLSSYTTASGNEFELDYYDNHLLKTISTAAQNNGTSYVQRMQYNDTGSVIEQKVSEENSSGNTVDKFLKSSQTFSTDRHFLTSSTDVNGNQTNYTYNTTTRQLNSVQTANGVSRSIEYDSGSDRIRGTSMLPGNSLNYSYKWGMLNVLSRISYTDAASETGRFNQEYKK